MMMLRVAVSLFVTGLVLGAGPCLLSCGPLLVSYVAAARQDARGGLKAYIIFSATRICVYLLLGVLAGLVGEHVLRCILESPYLGYLFIGCGLWIAVVGLLWAIGKPGSAGKCQGFMHRPMASRDAKNIVLFGLVVSLSPCLPLLAILGYIALIADTWLKGIVFMVAFGLGTTLSPVLFFILGTGWLSGRISEMSPWSRRIRLVAGVVLAYLGVSLVMAGVLAITGV